jgi:hypothetical protein
MDYLSYAIAMGPIGLYWILIGYLHERANPMLINAAQDTLLFGIGAVGMVLIGPMELFFPSAAYAVLGAWTWFLMLCLYGFIVLLIALNRRPQWTLYGTNASSMKGILERALEEKGIEHAWHGSILVVPELGIRALVESANLSDRAAQLTRCGRDQDIAGWHKLERWVTACLAKEKSNRGGMLWIAVGIALVALAIGILWMDLDRLLVAWENL